MGEHTAIEWTDATWNAIRARNRETGKVGWFCEKVAPECKNCYAEKRNVNTFFGNGIRYAADQRDKVELFLDERILMQPLHWKKPRQVFPCSMTDLFAEFVPDEWIDRIYAVMALCPQHTFQVLTKRPERRLAYMTAGAARMEARRRVQDVIAENFITKRGTADSLIHNWPLRNVWEGVSAGNQEQADKLIPVLLQTPAAVRWVSAEPMLGPVDLEDVRHPNAVGADALTGKYASGGHVWCTSPLIDWVVCGGESGPGARPMHPDWARTLRDQCQAAGVPFFFKQWGEYIAEERPGAEVTMATLKSNQCVAMGNGVNTHTLYTRVGKKQAGRLLDGVEHSGFPA